ncbi:MAG: FprA family A-type flavoprotein [Firmicutes bacterium]|nr:FprA family A-type flavoprotein [Bacillota bacterium]
MMQIRPGIHWVGVRDPDLEVFDVIIPTEYGTTYNSYLIEAQEPALVDGVKKEFEDEWFAQLEEKINLADLRHLIVNHTEPDHSGSIKELLRRAPHLIVHGTRPALQFLTEQVNMDFNKRIVGENDVLDLGNRRLRFIMAPFMHWPDTMWSYLEGEGVLFTCDGFGSHFCFPEGRILASQQEVDFTGAVEYYFEKIMGPFKTKVREALPKLEGLELDLIATGHGPILNTDVDRFIRLYHEWSRTGQQGERKRIVIAYASAYGHTKRMAELIAEGAAGHPQVDVVLMDAARADPEVVEQAVSSFDALIVGSPTINADAVYPIWRVLEAVSAINAKGKAAAVFGNYGWSGEAVALLEERLEKMRLVVGHPPLKVRFGLTSEDEERCRAMGATVAESIT